MEVLKALWGHENGPMAFTAITITIVGFLVIALILGVLGKKIRESGGRPVTAFFAQLIAMFFLIAGLIKLLNKITGINL